MRREIRNRQLRFIVALVAMFLPWPLKRRVLSWVMGYQVNPSARIGFSVVVASAVRMGSGARIGHFTVCRNLKRLYLADHARIGNMNWITGGIDTSLPRSDGKGKAEAALIIGSHSAITHRHYIDCSDRLEIGAFTTVAGVRSQIFTHSIDLELCAQQTRPVIIGDYCFVGTGCIILPGARLPNFSVLGAGAVLSNKFEQEWTFYAGVPAKIIKSLPSDYKYFHRQTGFVN